MSTPAVLNIVAEANRRESEKARELAGWVLDWPNVNYRHHPKESVPGVNLHEEYARYIARQSSGWSWALGVLVPKVIIARDLKSAARSLEPLCRVALEEGNSITRQNVLPGVLLGMLESYALFRDWHEVDRQALDMAVAQAATELLVACQREGEHTVHYVGDRVSRKEYEGRLVNAASSWAGPVGVGVQSQPREAVLHLIRSLETYANEGSLPVLPHQALLRQICRSVIGGMDLSKAMKTVLSSLTD